MKRRSFLGLAMALGLGAASALPAWAEDVLLTISGLPDGKTVEMTEADILALPQVAYDTETIWTVGMQSFSGPTVKSILQSVGADGANVRMTAVNNYSVEMPASAYSDEAPIVAVRRNGKAFKVRDKGPLWVVFPYDANAKFRTEAVYSYSIWQLTAFETLPN